MFSLWLQSFVKPSEQDLKLRDCDRKLRGREEGTRVTQWGGPLGLRVGAGPLLLPVSSRQLVSLK